MNVLSLFDGISCGRLALERAGIKVNKYYASEIDKHTITVSQANFPDIIRLGDVNYWKQWSLDWSSIDLIIGGSPCQGFSSSGIGLAFDDPRSRLFFQYVEILRHAKQHNPNIDFMLENVRMKKEFSDIMSNHLEREFTTINSNLVCPQSRPRLYWASWDIHQPEMNRAPLKSILDPSLPNCGLGGRIIGRRLNKEGRREDYNRDIPLRQYIEVRQDGIQNCLTTVYKDTIIPYENYDGRVVAEFNGGRGKNGDYAIDVNKCRMMTPLEYERLQTLPDGYTSSISQSQRYKAIGNAWTVDIIKEILKQR